MLFFCAIELHCCLVIIWVINNSVVEVRELSWLAEMGNKPCCVMYVTTIIPTATLGAGWWGVFELYRCFGAFDER